MTTRDPIAAVAAAAAIFFFPLALVFSDQEIVLFLPLLVKNAINNIVTFVFKPCDKYNQTVIHFHSCKAQI